MWNIFSNNPEGRAKAWRATNKKEITKFKNIHKNITTYSKLARRVFLAHQLRIISHYL
jgi:hypothetical protein